jgi:hypothetical protein
VAAGLVKENIMHQSGIKKSGPANVPMGSNRLSPVDQAGAIANDTAIVQSPFTIKDGGKMLGQAASNLRADSDVGRYAVPGYGDQGQFAGGSGSGRGGSSYTDDELTSGRAAYKHGGKVKKMASGGMTSSASKRADGIAIKGKTRGKMC